MITTVTGKNQVTIPAELARDLEIAPGTRLDWSKAGDDRVMIRIVPNRAELARQLSGRGRKYLRAGSNPVQDLIDDRVREDREEGAS
jgi:AbrB family looped-hinge helix DNA binding protein